LTFLGFFTTFLALFKNYGQGINRLFQS